MGVGRRPPARSPYSPPPLAGEDGWGAAFAPAEAAAEPRGDVRRAERPSPSLSRPAGEGLLRSAVASFYSPARSLPLFPSPACGGGWVGGRFRGSGSGGGAPRRRPSRRGTLTQPLPPSGRGAFMGARLPPFPLPRLRGRTGGGPLSRQRKRRRSPGRRPSRRETLTQPLPPSGRGVFVAKGERGRRAGAGLHGGGAPAPVRRPAARRWMSSSTASVSLSASMFE